MKKIDKIGLGTAAIGRPLYLNIRQTAASKISLEAFRKEGVAALDTAYMHGIRYFDTAPSYGMAEDILLNWVQEKRDPSIEVATKWGYTYLANFDIDATEHEVKEHTLKKLNEQWAKSKAFLPQLTTYQIHSATFETGVLKNYDILNRLAELKNEYYIRIGLTTTGANQIEVLKEAVNIEVGGERLFNVFHATYNIFDQSLASIATEFSDQNHRLIIKEAMANGRVFPNKNYPHYKTAYQLLDDLTRKYQVGIDAIALRFCIDSIRPVYKILSGAANTQQLLDNLKAADFDLEAADIAALKKLAVNPELYWNERKQLSWN